MELFRNVGIKNVSALVLIGIFALFVLNIDSISKYLAEIVFGKNKGESRDKPRRAKENIYGSAKIMELKELKRDFSTYRQLENSIENKEAVKNNGKGPGGIVVNSIGVGKKDEAGLYKKVDVTYNNGRVHHCIIGSTGSGKTTGLIANSIDSISNSQDSMAIVDPKGELYAQYHQYLKQKGYVVQVLNFENPNAGQNFNQLDFICQRYAEGIPYLYRSKAIRQMIKFIKYLRAENESERPELKDYIIYEGESSSLLRKNTVEYSFRPLDKIEPNTYGKLNTNDGEIVLKYLREVFIKSYKIAFENYMKEDRSNLENPKLNNVYLHYKQEQTLLHGLDMLQDITLEIVEDYFKKRLEYYTEFISTQSESSTLYLNAKTKIKEIEHVLKEFEETNELKTSFLLKYLYELDMEYDNIFKDCEQEASTNAQVIAEMLVESKQSGGRRGEAIWIDTPKALVASLILFVVRESHLPFSQHLGSVYRMLSDLTDALNPDGRDSKTTLDEITKSFLPNDVIRLNQTATRIAGDKTKASINVSSVSPIQIFADKSVVNQCARTSFDISTIADKPTAIFMNVPGKDTSQAYTVLASLFIEQLYTVLIKKAKSYGGSLPRAVYMLIDEFGNIPRIPNFGSKVSLARSYNIRFNYVLQDFTQLDQQYKEEKDNILGNSNVIYLLTNHLATAEWVSKRVGNYTGESDNESESTNDKGKSTSKSKQLHKVEIFTPQELMDENFKMGKNIYIQPRRDAFVGEIVPNYKMPNIHKINETRVNDLNINRPVEEVNYFVPVDYKKYIAAYKSFWEDSILDGFFYAFISVGRKR